MLIQATHLADWKSM